MNQFLWGALAMACITASVLFLRFWRDSGERLLLYFCLAFGVLALNWISLAVLDPPSETRHYFYLLRLVAFVLIIVGIVEKNRGLASGRTPAPRPADPTPRSPAGEV